MKRLFFFAAVLLALAATIYFRPLATFAFVQHVLLLARGFRGHDVVVGHWRIHYIEGGEGAPLVAIHGLGTDAESGALIFPTLAKSHHILAPDLLGYGHSDRPKDADYSIAMESEVVRGFMDAMHVDKADVLGVSMGGWVALKLAADHPERVRRLVLVGSAGFAFESQLSESSFSPATVADVRTLMELQTDRAKLMPDFVARDFVRKSRQEGWIFRRAMHSMLAGRDLMDGRVARVTMPTLLVWGTADRLVPFAVGERMRRELPSAKLVAIPNCGHLAVIECHAQALPPIATFLTP